MHAVKCVTRFSVRIVAGSLQKFPCIKLLKRLMPMAYFVCQQGCIMGGSEVLNGLSADFVLQIFIVPTSFHFRICYVIVK